ncbi:MAG: N-acetyltransferase [Gemmatimonadetes bacterium]|nr:N-acetyltransferase [Gemmatimonadota bacterium]
MSLEILHDEKRRRFRAEVTGGEARLDYRRDGGVVDFHSTYVPEEARGGGVAAEIVSRGFDWAKENGLRVVPSCSYVRTFVKRYPEYEPLVEEG